MIVYIDIDNTICKTDNRDYSKSIPIKEAIDKANLLYDNGNIVVYWTARGTVTGKDWTKLTKNQLEIWGVKYTELKFGKPQYNYFIDDKNVNAKDWLSGKSKLE